MSNKEALLNFLVDYEDYLSLTDWTDDLEKAEKELGSYIEKLNKILVNNISSFSSEEFDVIQEIIRIYRKYRSYIREGEPLVGEIHFNNDGKIAYEIPKWSRDEEYFFDSYEELKVDEAIDFKSDTTSMIKKFFNLCLKKENIEIKELQYNFPTGKLDDDITAIINLTYSEILEDYKNECYISAIALCGKVIETCISSIFMKIFNDDPDKKGLAFNAMLNRLKKEENFEFKELESQMTLISAHRNKAIHGSIIIPTQDEARGIISLTKDVMIKVVSKA